jgi:hypothetical protein
MLQGFQKTATTHGRKISASIAPGMGNTCMQPTWRGFIHTTRDGLTILEACLQGALSHIPRRPHDRERQSIISSGNIFVYEENASGIRRWTDGITWSPSRIMGNFLVYRELRDGHQPGEKKRAAKKRKRGSEELLSPPDGGPKTEEDRQLIGSLSLDAYNFKPGGLAKKTLSVELRGVRHHIISYYRVQDIKDGMYHRPAHDEFLSAFEPRRELLDHSSFKFPVEDRDDKVKMVVPPNAQLQPPHHMQMLNSGLPIVLNVSSQSHIAQSLTSAPQSGSSIMYHGAAESSYEIPTGSLDPFDTDGLQHMTAEQIQQDSQHQHQPVRHIRQVRQQSQVQSQQHRQIIQPALQSQHLRLHQGSEEVQAKRVRRMSQHPQQQQQVIYLDPSAMSQSLDFGFNAVPTLSSKYMDGMSPHHGFSGALPMNEMSHSSMYMMPQGQSFGR